jgi:hypothetical protein
MMVIMQFPLLSQLLLLWQISDFLVTFYQDFIL